MRYLLVDSNNLSARCFHAQNDLTTVEGVKTGAIYGSLRGLSWVRNTLKIPLYAVVMLWDGGHSPFRKSVYPDYKLGRRLNEPKTPAQKADSDAYRMQLRELRRILGFTEVKQVQVKGVEADDLISVFTDLLKQDGHHITIFSGDGDMHQLAEQADIFDPKKELLTVEQILTKWKLQRIQDIPLKKAIWGDTSDNITGIKGLGDKRASIACCYLEARDGKVEVRQNTWDEKDGKIVKKVLENQEIVERNLQLMQLPNTWDERFFSLDQAEDAMVQFLQRPKGDLQSFIAELRRYEMDSIVEHIGRW